MGIHRFSVLLHLNMSRILAIDYGKKRTGLAVTDVLQLIAGGLATVPTGELLPYILRYVANEPVELILIGLPKQSDNSDSENAARVREFAARLRKQLTSVAIEFVDERYTSVMAHRAMLDGGLKKKDRQDKALVDELSAIIMLQSYLEGRRFRQSNG